MGYLEAPHDSPELEAAKIACLEAETRKLNLESERQALEMRSVRHIIHTEESTAERALRYTFYNPIISVTVMDCMRMLDTWSRREPLKPMEIVFNSPGGGVTDGLALYDFIQDIRKRGHFVTTRCLGLAASMGAILLQAGDERVMSENSFMMIHAPSFYYQESSSRSTAELEDEFNTLKLYQNKGVAILAGRSQLTAEEIERRWRKLDWYLTAQQALELGLIDRIDS